MFNFFINHSIQLPDSASVCGWWATFPHDDTAPLSDGVWVRRARRGRLQHETGPEFQWMLNQTAKAASSDTNKAENLAHSISQMNTEKSGFFFASTPTRSVSCQEMCEKNLIHIQERWLISLHYIHTAAASAMSRICVNFIFSIASRREQKLLLLYSVWDIVEKREKRRKKKKWSENEKWGKYVKIIWNLARFTRANTSRSSAKWVQVFV